ncbi:SgcJ/EcaC family oxidoreductase [Terricaulis sp.]|uniref:SgcJ/EcaC family oxidoreductase n=1 Tax=Terricaulis sp. TaxID=2768686 RepID=UPI0037843D8F
MTAAADVETCYRAIIEAWNSGDPKGFAARFAESGSIIGYDGSPSDGRAEIEAHLTAIFKDHKPGRFVAIIREVRELGADAALVRAAVGVIPHGQKVIKPEVNFLQAMTAVREGGQWRAALLQATPAQFHGRPEMSERLTAELCAAAEGRS